MNNPDNVSNYDRINKKTLNDRIILFQEAFLTETSKLRHYVLGLYMRDGSRRIVFVNTNDTEITSFEDMDGVFKALESQNKNWFYRSKTKDDNIIEYVTRRKCDNYRLLGYFDGNLTIKNLGKLFPEYMV